MLFAYSDAKRPALEGIVAEALSQSQLEMSYPVDRLRPTLVVPTLCGYALRTYQAGDESAWYLLMEAPVSACGILRDCARGSLVSPQKAGLWPWMAKAMRLWRPPWDCMTTPIVIHLGPNWDGLLLILTTVARAWALPFVHR